MTRSIAITTVLTLVLPLAPAFSEGPITYRGVLMPVEGFPHIPHCGTTLHITVNTAADGMVSGRLRAMGVDAPLANVERSGEALSLSGSIGEMPVTAKLTTDGVDLRGTLSALEWVFPVVPLPEEWIPRAPKRVEQITKEDLLADLDYLARALPVDHKDWHALISKKKWQAKVAKARKAISTGTAETAHAGLLELVKLIAAGRDPHTWLPFTAETLFKKAPVQTIWLPDGLFITAAPSGYEHIIGGRVKKIGNVSSRAALGKLARLVAFDNPQWKRVMVGGFVPSPRLLHAMGVSDSPESLDLVVRTRDGKDHAVSFAEGGSTGLVKWDKALGVKRPFWLTRTKENYWSTMIDDGNTVYVAYNSCVDDPARPFVEFTKDIMSKLKPGGAGRLIIDLRNNPGGISNVIEPFMAELAANKVMNQPDRLFVLIGSNTFSSAMLNALQFKTSTRATLVGEPTGGKPNQYGNISYRFLPKSGLQVTISAKHFMLDPSDPPAVAPDVVVPLKSPDFFTGKDPVLHKVKSMPIKSPGW